MGVISFSGAIGTRFLELSRSHVPSSGRSCVFVSLLLEGVVCFLGITSYSKASGFFFFLGFGKQISIRASPFVPSRKAMLFVPSFYKTKLGVSSKSVVHEVGSIFEVRCS